MADTAAMKTFVKKPAYPRLPVSARESKPVKGAPQPAAPKAPKRLDPMLISRMLRIKGQAARVTPGTAF